MKRIIKLTESDLTRIVKRVVMERETYKGMSFMGATPMIKNDWTHGNGFFYSAYEENGIITSVMNSWDGGSDESKRNDFNTAEQMAIQGNDGSLDNSILFNYVTTVKAGNDLSLTFNATSKAGSVYSQTYSYRNVTIKSGTQTNNDNDTIYLGRFALINLPQNSTITITANGDSENKLVLTTGTPKKETTTQQGATQDQSAKTTDAILAKLESGKAKYAYYTLDKNNNTLKYSHGGVRNDVNTTVTIRHWDFKLNTGGGVDDNPIQKVYVRGVSQNDGRVVLSNSAGTAIVKINE